MVAIRKSAMIAACASSVASAQFGGLEDLIGGMMGGGAAQPAMQMGGMPRGMQVRVVRMGNPFAMLQQVAEMEAAEELRRSLQHAMAHKNHEQHFGHDEGIPMELQHTMNTLMHVGSDHSGHIGMTSGIHLEDTKEHFLISGKLNCDEPPKVDLAGNKLIIRGTHKYGTGSETFQRTYNLPDHLDREKLSVKFSAKTKAFRVEIPKKGVPAGSAVAAVTDEHHTNMPAEVQAVQQMLSEVFGAHPMMGAMPVIRVGGGFMRRAPMPVVKINVGMKKLEDLVKAPEMQKVHHDDVEFVGCFSEEQLPHDDYVGHATPSLFGAMYGKAHHHKMTTTGAAPKFMAMSVHESPQPIMGHGRLMDNFDMTQTPAYGKDQCGSRCLDDTTKWCGAANEPSRGYYHSKAEAGERRFAVYRLKDHHDHVEGFEKLADKHGDNLDKAIDEHTEQTKKAEEKNAKAKEAAANLKPHDSKHHAWRMEDDGDHIKFVMKVPADVSVATEGHDKIVLYTQVAKKQELMDAVDADFGDFKDILGDDFDLEHLKEEGDGAAAAAAADDHEEHLFGYEHEQEEKDHITFEEDGEQEIAKLTLPTAIDAEMCHHDTETNEVICLMPRDAVKKVEVKIVHDEF